jgi:cytochrome c oxidase subunit II
MQASLPSSWVGHESVLRPSGAPAHAVAGLFTFMNVVAALVYVCVIVVLLYAVRRASHRAVAEIGDDNPVLRRSVALASAATVLLLFGYLFYDFGVGRASAAPFGARDALHINLVGHQWWWEVQYTDTAPQRRLNTANEIHIPVHRPVLFTLSSVDVIHSFWIPNLNGKRDLVPGHPNDAWFEADTAGVYRGQCAEFCGLQHAKMAIIVIAESPEQFQKWYNAQLDTAATPTDVDRLAGQKIFLSGQCAMCHAIGGTPSGATFGPDLTHLASRMTLAAGVLPNTSGNLASWIADPQAIKPGTNMPPSNLSDRDLRSLVSYLEGLK